MEIRQRIENSILLCKEEEGGQLKRTFVVEKEIIAENKLSICYRARHSGSREGVLMEYYPNDGSVLLERRHGQLVCAEDSEENKELFDKLKEQYVKPYRDIMNYLKKNKDSVLDKYIPRFEIYYGCSENSDEVGSVYIWRDFLEAESFADHINYIRNMPEKNSMEKIEAVLDAFISLTYCIDTLHSCGMLHRGISPYSLGFIKQDGKTFLQMLDLSTICSLEKPRKNSVGEEGFFEPGTTEKAASVKSDIYSIGAMLFSALIDTAETKANGYIYKPEYLDRITDMVRFSKTMAAADYPRLRGMLGNMLQKCLCIAKNRYSDCDKLLKALNTAKKCLDNIRNEENKPHENSNPIAMMQCQLYEYPLYKYLNKDEAPNVLIVGFENYGQKFLDCVLQLGQMQGKKLNVFVAAYEPQDKKLYFDERPALEKFCIINDKKCANSITDDYGNISFKDTAADLPDFKKNPEKFSEQILKNVNIGRNRPHYVFVDIGNDDTNSVIAEQLKNYIENGKGKEKGHTVVGYARKKIVRDVEDSSDLCPVYVNAEVKKHKCYSEIMRMAFNTHLLWEKDLNCDYKKIMRNFDDPYNCNASIASVISVKYKLHTIGIDLDELGFERAAAEYEKLKADKANYAKIRDNLICDEHNRWVADKLCQGWQQFDDISECANGMTKDETQKRHICICPSKPEQKLKGLTKQDWIEKKKFEELDDLDKVSVELEIAYLNAAKKVREQDLLHDGFVERVESLLFDNFQARYIFDEWVACINEIWNNGADSIKNYNNLKNTFLNAIAGIYKEKSIIKEVEAFDNVFKPIRLSLEYRDWKDSDAAIVDNISFVLTYSQDICMVIPFSTKNEGPINNIAAATAVSPSKIIYLYHIKGTKNIESLKKAIPFVTSYMNRKNFRAEVELFVLYPQSMDKNNEKEELMQIGNGRITQVTYIKYDTEANIAKLLTDRLSDKSSVFHLLAAEKNNTALSELLSNNGFYKENDPLIPYYTYDYKKPGFVETIGCQQLKYISQTPHLTATDTVALADAERISSSQYNFDEATLNYFWKKYCLEATDSRSVWKNMCGYLEKYSQKNDSLYNDNASSEKREFTYHLPAICFKSIQKIMAPLCRNDRLTDVKVEMESAGRFKVEFKSKYYTETDEGTSFDKLFQNVNALMRPDLISIIEYKYNGNTVIKIYYDDLNVNELQFIKENSFSLDVYEEAYMELLEDFEKEGYILNYTKSGGTVSFTYASREIKELLTVKGKILEMFVYHAAKKSGLFDDVVTSLEVKWNTSNDNTDKKNEFDCVLTKGFQTLLVECKARREIDSNPYEKLSRLSKKFGGNTVPVMITDTMSNDVNNADSIKHGKELGVTTISDRKDFGKIAEVLMGILGSTNNSNS